MPLVAGVARRAAIAGLALLLVGWAGCSRREPSEAGRIEGLERVEVAPGRHVDAVRHTAAVTVAARRATLRGHLAAEESARAGCTIEGPGSPRPLQPADGGTQGRVDIALAKGEWRVACAPGARLEEPRLVRDGAGAARLGVLVVVDTLRDDHVAAATMPLTLDALAGARRFTDTRANASWTLPSMASALVSRPVLELTAPDGTLLGLPPGAMTVAERLRAAGFATAAFVANGTLREGNGFGQGFSRFETSGSPWSAPADAGEVLAAARAWIEAHEGEDAFAWIHLMEPHEPLRDHAGLGRVAVASKVLAGRERAPTPAEATTFRELYRLEVAHTDRLLGPFLRALPERAAVALTADHGEMLGEGTAWGHGLTLYDGVLRVPLLLRAPGVPPGSDAGPAELLDVVPTLLARLGVADADDTLAGVDLLAQPRRERPRLAATFSAGPLRWSYRRGDLVALAHFAPQPALDAAAKVVMEEVDPLPNGVWSYAPDAEPTGRAGPPLAGAALLEVAAAFARDVGGLVPGHQALLLDTRAGIEIAFATGATGPIARVHAVSAAEITRRANRLEIAFAAPQTLALVAFGATPVLRPLAGDFRIGDRTAPPLSAPGLVLWRNVRPPAAQQAQEDILEHLRALGYLR